MLQNAESSTSSVKTKSDAVALTEINQEKTKKLQPQHLKSSDGTKNVGGA